MADWWDDSGFSLGGSNSSNWWDSGQSFDIPTMNYDIPSFSLGSNDWSGYSANGPNFNFANQPMGSGINPGFGSPGGYNFGGGGVGGGQQPMGWGAALSNPQTLLGLGGLTAGLVGTLAGGGVKQTSTPKLSGQQKQQFGAAQQAQAGLQPFAQGQTPLQQQQMQLLQAISGGQGLAQPYAQAVEQSFEPQLGSLYEQATAAGRKRGFHDAPATSPAGGAVLGPGLSNLQGQMAQAKLAMMMGLPGLYQQPINQQMGAAQAFAGGQNNLFGQLPSGGQTSQPLGPVIGQYVGQGLTGIGAGMEQAQQQQNQQQFQNNLFQMMQRNQTPYQFGGYSGY